MILTNLETHQPTGFFGGHQRPINCVVFHPDGKTVYVADTETSRVFAWDIISPGVVKKNPFPAPYDGRLVCGLPGFQRFDSLALEASGNICVATLLTGHITVIAPRWQGGAPGEDAR